MSERNKLRLERDNLEDLDNAVSKPFSPSEYMSSCGCFADMVMLRALYLSWRSATLDMQRGRVMLLAEGIIRFTN